MFHTSDRSPLKAKSLRVAGQSLDEAMQKVLDNEVNETAAIIAIAVAMAAYEWFRAVTSAPPQPLVVSVCAVIATTWGVWRIRRSRTKLAQLRQGRDGERAVAEVLERMRESGYRVFHDVVASNFNIDHVLIVRRAASCAVPRLLRGAMPGRRIASDVKDRKNHDQIGFDPEEDRVGESMDRARRMFACLIANRSG